MKKIKILIIGLIALIVIIFILLMMISKNKENKIDDSVGDIGNEKEITNEIEYIEEIADFKLVENCVQLYYDVLNNNSDSYFTTDEEGNKIKIFDDDEINENKLNLLSEKYVKHNNITINNVNNYVKNVEQKLLITAIDMRAIRGENSTKYLAYAIATDLNYKMVDEFYIYVNVDIKNSTFSIEPINERYNNIEDIKIINDNTSININNTNKYINAVLGNDKIVLNYFNRYKILAVAKPELLYNILDREYRENRFGSLDNFINYVSNNKQNILKTKIEKYLVNYYDDVIEYVGKDQNNNYYIFDKKIENVEYTIKLDSYTVNTQEFIKKYNKGNNQVKVGMNIEKIIEALNNKDYNYIYNKLDNNFKNNNFANVQNLEVYLKNKLFNENEIEYKEFKQENDVFIYQVIIKSQEDDSQTKDVVFIMKLVENSDFVMSFNVE